MNEASIEAAEAKLKEAESASGAESADVATSLEELARLLEEAGIRKLDAVNLKARAKVIRSKLKNTVSDADEKNCPFCAESIKANAVFCRFCRKDIVLKREEYDKQTKLGKVLTREEYEEKAKEIKNVLFKKQLSHNDVCWIGLVVVLVISGVILTQEASRQLREAAGRLYPASTSNPDPDPTSVPAPSPANPLIGKTLYPPNGSPYHFINDHEVDMVGYRSYSGTYSIMGNKVRIVIQGRSFNYLYNGTDLEDDPT